MPHDNPYVPRKEITDQAIAEAWPIFRPLVRWVYRRQDKRYAAAGARLEPVNGSPLLRMYAQRARANELEKEKAGHSRPAI